MKRTDLTIVAAVAVLALVAAFYFVILSPKREEAAKLSTQISELEGTVESAEQLAATASAAEHGYQENYHRLVVLGKAVPEDADTSSLLVELQRIADSSKVTFGTIELGESTGEAAAAQVATPPPLEAPSSGEEAPAEGEVAPPAGEETAPAAEASTTPASTAVTVPTEATAATLPIGATVGPAALPVMPYSMEFQGGFFEIADFFEGLDDLVSLDGGRTGVSGRLMTVDGFSLTPPPDDGLGGGGGKDKDPALNASLIVTTYLTPAEQGLVAGGTPAAPAPTTATPTPAATTTTTPPPTTPAPTDAAPAP